MKRYKILAEKQKLQNKNNNNQIKILELKSTTQMKNPLMGLIAC